MRLLFIYFYKTKGTFEKGTIIELSKKYSVKHIGNNVKDYKFKLEKLDSFQDNFYGNNIDIGAIIGENGTGKSILINSLRDGSNDYSLAVYEKENGKFFYIDFEGKVFINKRIIEPLIDTSFVYYSPIIDIFNFEKENLLDVSDKKMFIDTDIAKNLALMENSDIQNFFEMRKIDTKATINQLKLNLSMDYFEKIETDLEKRILALLCYSLVNIELRKNNQTDFIDSLIKLIDIKNYMKEEFKNIENEQIFQLLQIEENRFLQVYFKKLEKKIIELLISKKNEIQKNEVSQYIDTFFLKIKASIFSI